MRLTLPLRSVPLLICLLVGLATLAAGEVRGPDDPLTIDLPRQVDLVKLTDLVAELTGVSMQYDPGKLKGQVRLEIKEQLTRRSLWRFYNQVLATNGITTVITGDPPIYQVVPVAAAAGLARVEVTDTELLDYQPGYTVLIVELKSISAELATKALGTVLSDRSSTVKEFGKERKKLFLTGVRERIDDARRVLALLDRPETTPAFKTFEPLRTAPTALQAAVKSAWSAIDKISAEQRPIEVQASPDGRRLLIIAESSVIGEVERLAKALDESEPVVTLTYRPAHYAIEDVARLIEQVMQPTRAVKDSQFRIVRNDLTDALIITATGAQHVRIGEIVGELDTAPETARRQVRSFIVRNRNVEDLAKILSDMAKEGLLAARVTEVTSGASPTPATPATPPDGGGGETVPPAPPPNEYRPSASTLNAGGQPLEGLVITTDPVTSAIIALGEPRLLAQLEKIIADLDRRQPQVELEVLLFSLSESESRELGVELMRLYRYGGTTTLLSSIFGLGGDTTTFARFLEASVQPTTTIYWPGSTVPYATVPLPSPAVNLAGSSPFNSGLNGAVIAPGDFGAVVRALETVTNGTSVIRTRVVVDNNAQASLSGVVQEPYSSINASSTVSTTSYGGTSDAGTQVSVTPQIAAGDHVSLVYDISQSSFIGNSVVSAEGSITPPPKRSDKIKSTATIPDGFVIALGGLNSRSDRYSESRLPILGSIPLLGHLFKTTNKSTSDSRFYVFIRANVLRHDNFEDLKHLSEKQLAATTITDDGWPTLKAVFID